MLIKINGLPIADEQEKLFQEVKESFVRFIAEYRKKHWFKELIYEFTSGEDMIDIDRIKAMLWYWKLRVVLKVLKFSLLFTKPSEEMADNLIEALEELRDKLEV